MISSISSLDDLMLYVKGYVKVTEEAELKALDEESKALLYPMIRKNLFKESDDIESEDTVYIFLMELKNDKASGSFVMYEDVYNGSAIVDGKEFEFKDYVIDFDYEQKKYVYVSCTSFYDGKELPFEETLAMFGDISSDGFCNTEIYNSVNAKALITEYLQTIGDSKDHDHVDKVYYREEVDGKTVSFCIDPYYVYPYDGRALEFISIDGVLYDTKGVEEFLQKDVFSISIYNPDEEIEYKENDDVTIDPQEGDTLNLLLKEG